MIPTRLLFTMAFLTLSSGCSSFAAIHLGDPFGEHMVLQQGAQVPIWGSGAPAGDTVRVSIAGQSATARSDWSGSWLVLLGPMKAGGPYQLLIEVGGYGPIIPSSAANSRGGVELNDVLVGEVRIAMKRPGHSSAMRDAETKTNGNSSAWIRIFEPAALPADGTRSATHGQWAVDSQYSTAIFSKESVYFARELYEELRIPIGVIDRSGLGAGRNRTGLQNLDWHALRHTHGTLLNDQGTPLKVAQAQLGHSHLATTLEIYTHTSVSAQRDAVNQLNDLRFPSAGPTS